MTPPTGDDQLAGFPNNAFGWYRRRFSVPANLVGKSFILVIGKVDDSDETFVNGVKVGALGGMPPDYTTAYALPRRYQIPAGLLKGDGSDVMAIRAYNGGGGGGLYVPEYITPTHIGPFDSDAIGGASQGYAVGDIAWYRRTLTVPKTVTGKRLLLTFDGVYHNSSVFLNGKPIGNHGYGYTPFEIDITNAVVPGKANLLAVKVDTTGQTSRWYSGSGIFRHVWLTTTPATHLVPTGFFVTTRSLSGTSAVLKATCQVEGRGANEVRLSLWDALGNRVLKTKMSSSGSTLVNVSHAHRWSPTTPYLYTAREELVANGKVVDSIETKIGIRTLSVSAKTGMLINGVPVKLRGGCVHHDNGALGSAAFDRAEVRRVELLKAAGYNAIRTSHNPPSPAFMDACDRFGMLVLDEAFDCWAIGKNPNDYGQWFRRDWKKDLSAMVLRDRNHPSVILWSIGNEIPEQDSLDGAKRAEELAQFTRSLDSTRPVTAAYSGGYGEGRNRYMGALDVAGYNYKFRDYLKDHAQFPDRVMVGTESTEQELFDHWTLVEKHPFIIGDFVWTSLDYFGEAGIGRVYYPKEASGYSGDFPYHISGCGDVDITGLRKPQNYYRGVLWGFGSPVAAFVDAVAEGQANYSISYWGWYDESPSWTWPGTEGKLRTVRVYSKLPKVRLLLNGRDLGVQETNAGNRYIATYRVPYQPGKLVALALDSKGKEAGRWLLKTAGKPAKLRVSADRTTINASGEDLSFVTVEVVDKDGNVCPNASNLVRFKVSGAGQIAAASNADPISGESFHKPYRKAFHGRCQAILQSASKPGTLKLQVSVAGLPTEQIVVRVR